ncbi:MAG: dihydroorotase [Candidatus Eremiobacteraeota bacterium]|nr:dihydroorotase [Candidatus Eremiobacteraeota bacterium]
MLIAGGRLIDPLQDIDSLLDVRIHAGTVAEIGPHLHASAGEDVFDATGCCVAPGFIDMHVHLREPGEQEKETIQSGTAAAAAGGFTAVACMPNTKPALDTPQRIQNVVGLARAASFAHVYPVAAITAGRMGKDLLDYRALHKAGAVAFSDDGATVMNAAVLRDAALAAAGVAGAFISHCEDAALKGSAVMHAGKTSQALSLPAAGGVVEDVIVARDLLLAEDTAKKWHIAHLSTRRGVELVQWSRTRGGNATCEVTPHHLLLDDEAVARLGAEAKVNPPLRSSDDAAALRSAVRDGTIDVFATDHAPHSFADKAGGMLHAAVGFSGLEVALGTYALAVPDLSLRRFVELLSVNPARILGVRGGTLRVGSPADITVFADRQWKVDPQAFYSEGKSTPFAGWTLPRKAIATIIDGHLVISNGSLATADTLA